MSRPQNIQWISIFKIVSHDMNAYFWGKIEILFARSPVWSNHECNFSVKSIPKRKSKVLANKSKPFSLLKCGRLFQEEKKKFEFHLKAKLTWQIFEFLSREVFTTLKFEQKKTLNLRGFFPGSSRAKRFVFGKSPLTIEGLISYEDSSGNELFVEKNGSRSGFLHE